MPPRFADSAGADKANRMGVNMADVGTALSTMLGGNYVNLFSLYGRSYQVIPQPPREFRFDPAWLTRYQVSAANGDLVPLSAVATVSEQVQPNALTSFQQLNSATLSGVPFPGRTLGEALDFLKAKSKEIFPEGYSYDFQGDSRQYEQEGNALVYVFVFALIVIYLVLAAQYESFATRSSFSSPCRRRCSGRCCRSTSAACSASPASTSIRRSASSR